MCVVKKQKEGLQVTNFKIGGFEMLKLRFGRSLIEYEMVFLWYLQKKANVVACLTSKV